MARRWGLASVCELPVTARSTSGGLLIGPADLSMELGVGNPGPNSNAPEVLAAIAKVGAACKRHNALCGIYMRSDVEERQEQGFMLFPSIEY